MECAQFTLGAYANGMSMAFAANLLVSAWASFYTLLEHRQRDLASKADALAEDPLIEEEVSIEMLRESLAKSRKIRRILWRSGFGLSLSAALYFYILAWHVSPDACFGSWLPWSLWAAAYAGPVAMGIMAATGMYGNRQASNLHERLQTQAQTKKAEAWDKQRAVDERMRRLSSRDLLRPAARGKRPPR